MMLVLTDAHPAAAPYSLMIPRAGNPEVHLSDWILTSNSDGTTLQFTRLPL